MLINHALEGLDLSIVFLILSGIGALLCTYMMQKSWHDDEANSNPPILRWLNRVALTWVGLCICWGAVYCFQKGWQPWPPALVLLGGLDFWFLIRSIPGSRTRADPPPKKS